MAIRTITKGRTILENKIKCKKCGSILKSVYPNDVVYCRCGSVWISGGSRKTLRGGEIAFVEELSKFL